METEKLVPWADARTPALAIVARGDQIETLGPRDFVVRSQSRPDRKYQVTVRRDRWACTCPFHRAAKKACIHILATRLRDGILDRSGGRPELECSNCRSGDVIRFGTRHNKGGTLPRYFCKTCRHRFTNREGFLKRRTDPEKIALALDLYFRGLSLRKIAEHFGQVFALSVSPTTVYSWIVRYSTLAASWMNGYEARTGERWHIDETVISANGKPWYLWNAVDAKTRFLMATHVSRLRSLKETRTLLEKAKASTTDRPMEVFTDGMKSYPKAIAKELGYRAGFDFVNPHYRVKSLRGKNSNNLVERLHGTEKDRIRTMRGFDNSQGSAAIMEGFRVHYNMVRRHSSLGTTPAVAAGIPDPGKFRWKEIIKQASRGVPAGKVDIEFIIVKPT